MLLISFPVSASAFPDDAKKSIGVTGGGCTPVFEGDVPPSTLVLAVREAGGM